MKLLDEIIRIILQDEIISINTITIDTITINKYYYD